MTLNRASSKFFTPFPFLFCILKFDFGILFISPFCVIKTTQSTGITVAISFSSLGNSICANSVLLLSPYFLTIAFNLFLIIIFRKSEEIKICCNSCNLFNNSFFSFSNSNFSNFAKLDNLIASIDFACSSFKLYLDIRDIFAAAALSLPLINFITLSISSKAINNPSTIFNLAFVLSKSNSVSFIMHCSLCLT